MAFQESLQYGSLHRIETTGALLVPFQGRAQMIVETFLILIDAVLVKLWRTLRTVLTPLLDRLVSGNGRVLEGGFRFAEETIYFRVDRLPSALRSVEIASAESALDLTRLPMMERRRRGTSRR
jgi:hypothetical protein